MKRILIVAATETEVKELLIKRTVETDYNSNIKSFFLDNKKVEVLITTVGMVATTYYLTKALSENRYDYVINMGICGSFNPQLKIAEVVEITEDIFAEIAVDTSEGLKPFGIAADESCIISQYVTLNNTLQTNTLKVLNKVRAITVNTITGSPERKKMLSSLYKPDVESMEGAAFLYVCNAFNKKCSQIRSISNDIGHRNKHNWHIEQAVQKLTAVIEQLLEEL